MANQITKLGYVDAKLGAPVSGQQTTRTLFHTRLNVGAARSIEFFNSFNGLTLGQTNLTENKLDSAESMVIKTISFLQFEDSVATAFGNASLATNYNMTIDVIIGNQRVVKALPISFNQGASGQSFDRLHEAGGVGLKSCEIRLLTDIVIPPQTEFIVRVNGSGFTNFGEAAVCVLSGYGKIFSAGSSF
jgi:hypothetical protein